VRSSNVIVASEAGFTPGEREFLTTISDHALVADFARLARASSLDAGGGRWQIPFPGGITTSSVPVPELGRLRELGYAHVAGAVLAWVDGRAEEAEERLREVVSVGFLMEDEDNTLGGNLVGNVVVRTGGGALGEFYRASGQVEAHEALQGLQDAMKGARWL